MAFNDPFVGQQNHSNFFYSTGVKFIIMNIRMTDGQQQRSGGTNRHRVKPMHFTPHAEYISVERAGRRYRLLWIASQADGPVGAIGSPHTRPCGKDGAMISWRIFDRAAFPDLPEGFT